MIDQDKRKKIFANATDFLFALFDLRIIEKNMNESSWIGTFGPPYFVLYLNYLYHFYYEMSKEEIDELSKEFVKEHFGGNKVLINKMITTNKEVDSLINRYRNAGLDYASGWAACFFVIFNLKADAKYTTKIEELAYKMTADRRCIKPELQRNKTNFVAIAKGISKACKEVFDRKRIAVPAEYFDGLGLYCTKWFCRFEYSSTTMKNDRRVWLDRSFVTQYFIMNLIEELGNSSSGYSGTKCFTMWNHLNKFNAEILGHENSLIKAIILFVETNTNNNMINKNDLVNEINKKIVACLTGVTLRF